MMSLCVDESRFDECEVLLFQVSFKLHRILSTLSLFHQRELVTNLINLQLSAELFSTRIKFTKFIIKVFKKYLIEFLFLLANQCSFLS